MPNTSGSRESLSSWLSPFVVLPVVAGLIFGLVWALSEPGSNQAAQKQEQQHETGVGPEDPELNQGTEAASREQPKPSAPADPDGSVPAGAGGLEAASEVSVSERDSEAYFAPPSLDAEGRYASLSQPVTWSASCTQTPGLKSFSDLRDFVVQQHGLPLEAIPTNMLAGAKDTPGRPASGPKVVLLHLNQYYRDTEAREYGQMSIVHRGSGGDGGGYRIERFRFRDADLAEMIAMDIVAPPGGQFDLDAESVRRRFAAELDLLVRPRFVTGTREIVYRSQVLPVLGAAATKANTKPLEAIIELTGGHVSAYTTSEISCESTPFARDGAGATFCTCYYPTEAKEPAKKAAPRAKNQPALP